MSTTAIKERPIKFTREMIRAILEGRKTQTRRIVSPQPATHLLDGEWIPPKCPYGKAGDLLRLSEEVCVRAVSDDRYSLLFAADLTHTERYGTPDLILKIRGYKKGMLRGVHLPPAYARSLRLTISSIRLERLNDISDEDAIAEGWPGTDEMPWSPRGWYQAVWQSIHGEEAWDMNAWVWAIEWPRISADQTSAIGGNDD